MATMPWFKVQHSLLDHPAISTLPLAHRWIWDGLMMLASKLGGTGRFVLDGKVPMSEDQIVAALHIPANELAVWNGMRDYLLSLDMLAYEDDGKTLCLPSYVHWQERSQKNAAKQKAYRERKKTVAPSPAPATEGEKRTPLDECIAYLNDGQGVAGEKFNPVGALMRLYRHRYGDLASTFPPNPGRLGQMANQLSGGAVTMAKLLWESGVPAGNPHDYLAGLVNRSPAARRTNGTAATAGRDKQPVMSESTRRMMEAQRRGATNEQTGN